MLNLVHMRDLFNKIPYSIYVYVSQMTVYQAINFCFYKSSLYLHLYHSIIMIID